MNALILHRKQRLLLLWACALLCATSLVFLSSCSKPADTGEILTQKTIDSGRTPLTVMVKYAFSIHGFEQAVEEKFPDIDLIQVGNYSRNMGTMEYERRLKHDDLTDIVMTWPLDVGEEYWGDRLLDLSGFDFTSRYAISMLNAISKDGALYYVPGPSQVRGIVYNKTLFQEKGWQVPTDYESFVQLCQTIENTGIRSIQLGFQNQEVLDTAFVGYNYGNYFSQPQDIQWLNDYNTGTGSFGDHFSGALDVFQEMKDKGIWKPTDLNVDYTLRETMFFTRECAMVEDSVLMTRIGDERTGTTDEFALMPFFNPADGSDWARLYMVCYVGLNSHLTEPENKKKFDLALKLMDYISTPEGQQALSSDTGAMFSSLIDSPPPDLPEIEALVPALQAGRYAIFPQLKNAQSALRKGLQGMLTGELTKAEVCDMVDAENASPPQVTTPVVLGRSTKDFTFVETGSFLTDAMAKAGTCEIALFLDNGKDGRYNNKGLSGRLYEGEITDQDLLSILPDYKSGDSGTLCTVTMTGENLIKTLEYAIPVENEKKGWFYYFSGLRMTFSPTASPGSRITKVTTADGKEIETDKQYTVAVMNDTIPAEYADALTQTDQTIQEIFTKAIQEAGTISPSEDGRFTILS